MGEIDPIAVGCNVDIGNDGAGEPFQVIGTTLVAYIGLLPFFRSSETQTFSTVQSLPTGLRIHRQLSMRWSIKGSEEPIILQTQR